MKNENAARPGAGDERLGKFSGILSLARFVISRKSSRAMSDLWYLTADLMIVIADVRTMLEGHQADLARIADRLERLEGEVFALREEAIHDR